MFELTKESTCSFRIWQNSLRKYGKYLKQREIKELLSGNDVIVTLYTQGFKPKKTYQKYITINEEYGISVIWDIDIEE